MKKNPSFGFAAGVVKVRETRLIPAARWRVLADMSRADFLSALKDTDYGQFISDEGAFDDLAALRDHWRTVRSWPGAAFVSDFIFLKNDYLNAKIFCRARLLEFEAPLNFSDFCLEPDCLDLERLKAVVFEGKMEKVSPFLAAALVEIKSDNFGEKDPARVDFILDRAYLEQVKKIAAERTGHFFRRLAEAWIEIYNLGAFVRVKAYHREKTYFEKYFVEGGRLDKSKYLKLLGEDWEAAVLAFKSGGLIHLAEAVHQLVKTGPADFFESELREMEMKVLNQARFLPAGPEAVVAFALRREQEIRNIKIMESAKKAGLEPARIMALMETAYA